MNTIGNNIDDGVVAYTNGAFIQGRKCGDGLWRWVVTSFEDDTFLDGEMIDTEIVGRCASDLYREIDDED